MQPKFFSLRGLNFCCLQSGHIFLFFIGAFQHGQTEVTYFEIDKIPLTVSSPRVISFAMFPSRNSQTNRRDRSDVGHYPLSDSSVLHSDILLTRTPCSPLFAIKGHPQPWKLKIPIFWHHCLNSPIILSWLLLGINTISRKTSSFISDSERRNQAVFTLRYFYKTSVVFLLFLCIHLWIVEQETRAVSNNILQCAMQRGYCCMKQLNCHSIRAGLCPVPWCFWTDLPG